MDKRVVALVALLAAGCGGSSPGSPSDPLAFQAGRYRLSIIGLQCGSKEFETALPSVVLAVTVRPDGAAWVALPEHANGTLTLRFEKGTAIPNLQAVVVTGTVSGSADDEGSADTPAADATHVQIARATLSGTMPSPESVAGTIGGQVLFTRDGGNVACIPGAVSWTISRFGSAGQGFVP